MKQTKNEQAQGLFALEQNLKTAMVERSEAYERMKTASATYRDKQADLETHKSGRQVLGFNVESVEIAKRERDAAQAEFDRIDTQTNRIASQIDEIREAGK